MSATERHGWVWLIVAVALVTTSLVWYADQRARREESTALARCEHRLSDASLMSEIRMGPMQNYLRPATTRGTGVSGSGQLHLADLMSGTARRALPRVLRAHRTCGEVRVEPWHFALLARRSAATAYAGALITLLETVASQGDGYFQHGGVTLARLREAAGID
jgi:hypothetical protein